MMKQLDLNDLYFFVQAVDAGNFSLASRQLNISKPQLSRRVAKLEQQLGVQLIQRNTHQFQLTSIGQFYYENARQFCLQAENLQRLFEQTHHSGELQGKIRFSCPVEILDYYLSPLIIQFMQQHPKVEFDILSINRDVDMIKDRCDLIIQAKSFPLSDTDFTVKTFFKAKQLLVASPALVEKPISELTDLLRYPTLSEQMNTKAQWIFIDEQQQKHIWHHQPKLVSRNLNFLVQACIAGQGIALLPYPLIEQAILQGKLHDILSSKWQTLDHHVYAMYAPQQGKLPLIRQFIAFLNTQLKELDLSLKIAKSLT